MKKRILAGLITGIALAELLSFVLPANALRYYLDILVASIGAAVIGGRVILGVTIAVYVLAWKFGGLYFMTAHYGTPSVGKQLHWFLFDYLLVLVSGLGGGWLGVLLRKIIRQRKERVSSGVRK